MSNKFSNNLKQKLKMKQLKIKSFLALLGLIMFANIMATAQPLCPPVSYLTATISTIHNQAPIQSQQVYFQMEEHSRLAFLMGLWMGVSKTSVKE
jgi:hypothetical protein